MLRRHPRVVWTTVVVSPLVLAAVVLLWRPWVPVLDMAMTEFRVRDVGGRHTPLVGLPGRIGDFPDQGSHPGPWSFYLVAPWYRLAGSTAWGMELASVVVNAVAAGLLVWMGHRRFGARGAVALALVAALAVRGYGLTVLTHPWNPYFPLLIWLVALVAAWLVVLGDHWLALLVAAAASVAAQTHVPYLVNAIALCALVLVALVVAVVRARAAGERGPIAPLAAMVGLAGFLWLPPFVQELRNRPGNISELIDHFTGEHDEPAIGFAAAARLLTQHFDVLAIAIDEFRRKDALVHRAGQVDGVSPVGVVVLLLWVAALGWAWRRRHRPLLALHLVTGIATLVGVVSMSRIFGKVWFYLTLWMSGTVLLVALALGWTVVTIAGERGVHGARERTSSVVAGATAVVTVVSIGAAVVHQVPERGLGDDVRQIVPEVVDALESGAGGAPGKDGSYIVFWQESVVPGAQGYALMNELERRGFRVGVHPTWRVPATSHRVRLDGEYDAEVHLVSGEWITDWRTRGFTEILEYDGRTAEERARFDELEARVDRRLVEIGRGDLIEVVELNIFGASLDPGLPDDIVADLGEMLLLGEEIAIFVAPPGSTF